MFAYLGEEKALMEEVAVLIRRFQTRMKQERREFQIQGVLIQCECLKAPRSDAGVLAKMLGIPCMALGKNGIWKRQALAGELKNLYLSFSPAEWLTDMVMDFCYVSMFCNFDLIKKIGLL